MKPGNEFQNRIENKLKRKKFLKSLIKLLLILAILFFLFSIVYAWFVGIKNTNVYLPGEQEREQVQVTSSADSDGDGLFDWQEDLYGTSKKLRDSDGDGVTDGEEVALGQDPNYYGEGISQEDVIPQEEIYPDFVYSIPETSSDPRDAVIIPKKEEILISEDDVVTKQALNSLGLIIQDTYLTQESSTKSFTDLFIQQEGLSREIYVQAIGRYKNAAARTKDISLLALQSDIDALSRDYLDMASALESLIQDLPEFQENHSELLVAYGSAAEGVHKRIIRINAFVRSQGMDFKASEPGSYFEFNL